MESRAPRSSSANAIVLALLLLVAALAQAQDSTTEPAAQRTTVKKELGPESPEEEALMPRVESLFQKDALDRVQLFQMDCHLRNIDYCYAGLLGAAQRALPETDADFENRCDEMRAAGACLALYNHRCGTLKVFSALAPFANMQPEELVPEEVRGAELPALVDSVALNRNASGGNEPISIGDLVSICEPSSRNTEANKALRRRLFELARCVNSRIPQLRPCLEDLKTAVQLFYEPSRSLPLRPSCCAMSRFRDCATKALDGVCGLSSFDQLEASLNSGPSSMVRTIGRVCRQAARFDSPYCVEILPPAGLKTPQRRGRKASKLAKALDLIQFAPATQDQLV